MRRPHRLPPPPNASRWRSARALGPCACSKTARSSSSCSRPRVGYKQNGAPPKKRSGADRRNRDLVGAELRVDHIVLLRRGLAARRGGRLRWLLPGLARLSGAARGSIQLFRGLVADLLEPLNCGPDRVPVLTLASGLHRRDRLFAVLGRIRE